MPKRKKKSYKGYTATEQDLLNFCKWVLLISFVMLVIAAIITTNTKLMQFSVFIGIVIAYLVHKEMFDA